MKDVPVTLWVALLIIVVFVLQSLFGFDLAWTVGTVNFGFVTSLFAHANMAHLLGNLFALLLFGLVLEGVVGKKRWIIVFVGAAVLGNVAGIGTYTRVIGASGAIYGLIGALALLRPRMVMWVSGMPMPMLVAAFAYAFVDVVGLFANTSTGHLAHLAGIVVGGFAGIAWRKDFIDRRRKKKVRVDPNLDAALDQWEETYLKK